MEDEILIYFLVESVFFGGLQVTRTENVGEKTIDRIFKNL